MFVSLLIHEYGHAITAQLFGAKSEITLEAFGGHASYKGKRLSSKKEFLITLNGPLLESLLIVTSYFLLKTGIFRGHPYINYALVVTMRLNIIWCLFNLIPLLPLDGGYIARYILGRVFGAKGVQASIFLGLACCICLSPYFFIKGYYFFGVILLVFGFQNYQLLQKSNYSPNENNASYKALNVPILNEATFNLKKQLKSKDPKKRTTAAELLAKRYYEEGLFQKANRLLLKAEHSLLKEGKFLLCKIAFQEKRFEFVKKYAYDNYETNPSFETAILNSKAFAALSDPERSGGWLKTASLFGSHYDDEIKNIMNGSIYEKIKNDPRFQTDLKFFN